MYYFCLILFIIPSLCYSDDISAETTVQTTTTTESINCEIRNSSCDYCVADSNCYWCTSNSQCHHYTYSISQDDCPSNNDVKYKICYVSMRWLIIGLSIGFVLVILTIICCCYCCCKKGQDSLMKREMRKWERRMKSNREAAEERRRERSHRMDEIRRKYGIQTNEDDENSKRYRRFD